ncbi:MAG: hypothetical protein IKL36_08385 [Clostridia bacterium]|nr:hypothetical protein [Clostridia bacterium]
MPKIVNLGTPPSPAIYTKNYKTFRGVDFSVSETMVDDSRSPYAVNVISDTGGFPEKRLGWRTVKEFGGRINGIFHYKGMVGEEEEERLVDCFVIHAGDKIYSWSGYEDHEPTELMSGVNDEKSTARLFKNALYILTGKEFLCYDGEKCTSIEDGETAYAPTTWEGRGVAYLSDEGDGSWHNSGQIGQAYQEVNIACAKRKNTFRITADFNYDRYIFLDGKIKANSRIKLTYIPTGEVLLDVIAPEGNSGKYVVPDGFWGKTNSTSANWNIDIFRKQENSIGGQVAKDLGISEGGYIVGLFKPTKMDGYIAPAEGEDNFCVEYVAEGGGEQSGSISKCTVMDVFENRIFYSGNPDFPNTDWHSELNEPTYVTDLSYTDIGLDSVPIVGYLRTGSEQAILKGDGEDSSLYMRYRAEDGEGNTIFPVRQGSSNVGAVSKRAVCTLLDDPMYLSASGVWAIAQQDISSERALNIRSTRINKKLLENYNLEDAHMCRWRGNLLLFINGECYVADAAQKTYAYNKTGTFEYEWYYWTNIPARTAMENGGVLWFGTEDGRLCRFNDDMKNSRGEIEPRAYSDDGEAIVAEWATTFSDDGDFMRLKTMKKKGSGVMLKTYIRSGVKVCIRTDKDFEREIRSQSAGIFNFEDVDFSDFTFNTSEYLVVPFNAKFKKYKAIQVICRNDKVNQAFGVLGIIRRYVIGNFAK